MAKKAKKPPVTQEAVVEGKPCASCPFLKTNFKEFGEVAKALCKKLGQPEPDFWQTVTIRDRVCRDGIERKQLRCHSAVYDKDMNANAAKAHECIGLQQHLRENRSA